MKPLHPRPLKAGSRIAVTCPAGPVDPQRLSAGIARLEGLGWEVIVGRTCGMRAGLWSAEESIRAEELVSVLTDPAIDAVIAGRGGVGCLQLLPYLSNVPASTSPKWVVGRSDLTSVLLSLWHHRGWIGLSGPMAAGDFGGEMPARLLDPTLEWLTCAHHAGRIDAPEVEAWIPGLAEGRLIPANLSILASMIGTGHFPSTAHAIIVLEEINEPLWRIDRMLTQLRLAGAFDGISGLVLGQFTDCVDEARGHTESALHDLLRHHAERLGVPTLARFPYGHERSFVPLPVGVTVRIADGPPGLEFPPEEFDA